MEGQKKVFEGCERYYIPPMDTSNNGEHRTFIFGPYKGHGACALCGSHGFGMKVVETSRNSPKHGGSSKKTPICKSCWDNLRKIFSENSHELIPDLHGRQAIHHFDEEEENDS